MLRISLRVAWRHLKRNKVGAILNITGLAIGITACLLATLFISDELSYDQYHQSPQEIFRFVTERLNADGSVTNTAVTPPAVGGSLAHDVPEVVAATRIFPGWGNRFFVRRTEGSDKASTSSTEPNVIHVDPDFFKVFTTKFLQGTSSVALTDPNSIVLTESMASKYFKNENAIGQILLVDDWAPCKVTAVIADVPENSHFKYDFLVPVNRFLDLDGNSDWNWNSFYTYFRLPENSRINNVESKIASAASLHHKGNQIRYLAQPLTSIHLNSHLQDELSANGDERYLYIFATISFFLFLIACINSAQLITAYSLSRARETGIRRVSGATIASLVRQFLSESVLTTLLAVFVSLILAQLALPELNSLTEKSMSLFSRANIYLLPVLFVAMLAVGIVCGVIPSIQLSKIPVSEILKGKFKVLSARFTPNRILIVSQFVIATTLITCTLIIYSQTKYMQQTDPGFNKDQVLFIQDTYALDSTKSNALREALLQVPGVTHVAATDGDPLDHHWTKMISRQGTQQQQLIHFLSVEPSFFDVLQLTIVDGKRFTKSDDNSRPTVILNETAVKQLGIASPVVGQQIKWKTSPLTQEVTFATITGVVADFHFASMRDQIAPFILVNNVNRKWNYAIRISSKEPGQTINKLKTEWDRFVFSRPFQFFFLDESYDKLYRSEQTYQKIFSWITGLCLVTACLGLFGICAYVLGQRLKETSIRKLLGASIGQLFVTLTSDIVKIIVIASLLSLPIAWWLMHSWLNNFAYRVRINWLLFVSADVMIFVGALLTISFQVFRAARVNPAKYLGEE